MDTPFSSIQQPLTNSSLAELEILHYEDNGMCWFGQYEEVGYMKYEEISFSKAQV